MKSLTVVKITGALNIMLVCIPSSVPQYSWCVKFLWHGWMQWTRKFESHSQETSANINEGNILLTSKLQITNNN